MFSGDKETPGGRVVPSGSFTLRLPVGKLMVGAWTLKTAAGFDLPVKSLDAKKSESSIKKMPATKRTYPKIFSGFRLFAGLILGVAGAC